MYSGKIQEALKSKGIQIGDFVKVTKESSEYSGMLMPRIELGNRNCLVLKLENGYNTGIEFDDKLGIEKTAAKKEKIPQNAPVELDFNKKKPKVSLIVTGGTIGSRVEYKTGGVEALMSPQELLELAPELADFVNLHDIVRPFTKMSEDMDHEDWQRLAEIVAKEINQNEGIVVTHGTDTLHYTAAALSFMLKGLNKPVVLTGSQRSSDRGSTDAAMNLLCSSYVAGYSDFAEVGICMHGTINDDFCLFMRGTNARKMHTSRRDTFRPINDAPLAMVWPSGKIEMINRDYKKKADGKVVADIQFEPKIALLKAYPGSEPNILNLLIDNGIKGFVIEGTGLGHVPTNARKSWIPAIKEAISNDIPIVVTSQALYGRTDTKVYANLRVLYHETNAICAEGMLSETAYVKLGWVLGHEDNPDKARKLMLTNIAGEIPGRILPETFLY